jgi:L-alanine-DL-glutamate epimerase-like enolase superfamily enzyme
MLIGIGAILGMLVQTGAAQVRIDSVDLKEFSIPLNKTFKTSKGSSDTCYGIFVLIHASDIKNEKQQFTALGSILPRTLVTNESKSDAWRGAVAMRRILIGRTLNAGNLAGDMTIIEDWLIHLDEIAKSQKLTWENPPTQERQLRATLSGFDMALLDLLGQVYNKPIADLFEDGKDRQRIVRSAPTYNANATIKKLTSSVMKLHEDYPAVRIKIGLDFDKDLQRLTATAQAIAQSPKTDRVIWVDVNQAWKDAPTSLTHLKQIADAFTSVGYSGAFICEQPTAEKDLKALADVTHAVRQWDSQKKVPIKIMADEAIWILDDIKQMLELDAADIVNIKIQKAGGIVHAMKMGRYLYEHAPHVEVYIGGLVMTDIGAWANVQLCFALPRMDYQTSGAPRRNFPGNPATHPIEYANGRQVARPTLPGLGTGLNLKEVEPYITKNN